MTEVELIAVARTHTIDFPKLSGEPWANQENLNKISTLETVVEPSGPSKAISTRKRS